MTTLRDDLKSLDDKLSNRFIDLDPGGYWIIAIDASAPVIRIEHYGNAINDQGLAVDPETGEVIACRGGVVRRPSLTLTGQTAKELCIKLFEELDPCPVTRLDHAAYLGRELVRAELALVTGTEYIQD
ncbi:DUF4346 domain-containing protein [Synechocystis sp. LKSZ1]|uniref:DUF4346 domain-containing protein n=1 Tax=Synechocystis sp. LKSZ1 TaxID=3144951 RepID=UPI00336BF977